MWLVYFKKTHVIMAEDYHVYYSTHQDALNAIQSLELNKDDCEVCPVLFQEDFCGKAAPTSQASVVECNHKFVTNIVHGSRCVWCHQPEGETP